jgi:Xaa-Pro aminopeptidase
MYPHQLERLTGVLDQAGLEALVATTPANIDYVTGFRSLTQEVYGTRQTAVFTRRGTALVVPAVDLASIVVDAVEVDHVACYGGFVADYADPPGELEGRIRALAGAKAASPAHALAGVLDALGVSGGRIGLDEGLVTPQAWQRVVARLGPREVVPAVDHFLEARRVKGPFEIERLGRALHIAEEALNAVIQVLKPGVTEREAALLYDQEARKRGGHPYGVIIAMGERAALPGPYPTARALRTGDLVRLDVGCVSRGYHAEVARTAVMGAPSPRQETAHNAIQAGLEELLAVAKPGVPAAQLHQVAVATIRGAGLPTFTRYHLGHGIGLEPYERPKLADGIATPLETGEILRIEAPYYQHGGIGLNVKDTVLVTTSSVSVLNRSARGLIVLD